MSRDPVESQRSLLTRSRWKQWLGETWTPGVASPAPGSPPATTPDPAQFPAEGAIEYSVTVARVGQCEVPGPFVHRTSRDDDWQPLSFYFVAIRGGGKTVVVNTGLPEDLTRINQLWTELGGPRCRVTRNQEERLAPVLARLGVAPKSVDYVIATPFKEYLLTNLSEFPNATVCVSQHGWTEHYLARRYPTAVPDPLAIPDELLDRLERGTPNPLRLLRDEDEILPGVRVFWVGVHDRSTMAIVVHTSRGDVVITDACATFENVEQMSPIGTADSLEACLNAYVRIRHAGKFLLPLNDPTVLERFEGGRIA